MANIGRVRRISDELDRKLQDLAIKNNIKYIDASREMAKVSDKVKNRRIFKEIKF